MIIKIGWKKLIKILMVKTRKPEIKGTSSNDSASVDDDSFSEEERLL